MNLLIRRISWKPPPTVSLYFNTKMRVTGCFELIEIIHTYRFGLQLKNSSNRSPTICNILRLYIEDVDRKRMYSVCVTSRNNKFLSN